MVRKVLVCFRNLRYTIRKKTNMVRIYVAQEVSICR